MSAQKRAKPQVISVGDRVAFFTAGHRKDAHNGRQEGTVVRIRTRRSRKLQRMMRYIPVSADTAEMLSGVSVAEVSTDSGVLWTLPVMRLTRLGTGDLEKARGIKSNLLQSREEHYDSRRSTAKEHNLSSLKEGAQIEVKFGDIGWARRTFIKLSSTGRVQYMNQFGRTRWTDPRWVRVLGSTGEEKGTKTHG